MPEEIIEQVLLLTGFESSEALIIQINAIYASILSYLYRDNIEDHMIPLVSLVIAECLKQNQSAFGNVQSLSEGDLSVSYASCSPFFGKLDSFKLIRGIENV